MYMEVALYNAIIKWFDDASTDWGSINDTDWIKYVCEEIGITEEEYKRIMELNTEN